MSAGIEPKVPQALSALTIHMQGQASSENWLVLIHDKKRSIPVAEAIRDSTAVNLGKRLV